MIALLEYVIMMALVPMQSADSRPIQQMLVRPHMVV
jgi:hypothetical protein